MQTIDRIMSQAANRPDARAIVTDRGTVSYGELIAQAASVAQVLRDLPDAPLSLPVGIGLPKSPAAVAVMLGALLAGRAYLPMDPALPASRRADMIADSGADVVYVADDDTLAQFRQDCPQASLRLVGPDLSRRAAVRCDQRPPGADAALLYTSGSTNRPKGVRLGRGGVDVFVDWAIDYFGLQSTDRLASHAPFGFDISLLDLWAGLAAGAEVHLVPEGQLANGRYLIRFLNDHAITFWQSVPAPLTAIAAEIAAGHAPPASLRQICATGEVLPGSARVRLARLGPQVTLHNIYGCTETNDTFVFSLPVTEAADDGDLPIGLPVAYADFLIVDENCRPVPRGMSGELLTASGAGFTGYTDPAQTEAAHVTVAGQRYYRTHDLVCQDHDGMLHFLGRADHTIKLRGMRIDLREIEAALEQYPPVRDVVALAMPCDVRGRQLICVIASSRVAEMGQIALKAHCARLLPRQAIPDRFVIRDQPLPRNPNGKIDRRAVAAWLAGNIQQKMEKTS
ncbi:amino acid adenylation domain-containing protein [Paracoccus sp. (in: a-proteobacteria)]|uniref:amino acid adenylation domain-containing protein n=1 Tax=Paracoccus sp. TaxID=267 RepID=UPI003A89C5C4